MMIRRTCVPLSVGCYFIANKNDQWERKLQQQYREWYNAHEEYRRAVKMVSKQQSDSMSLAAKNVEEGFYRIDNPRMLVKAVKNVASSYRGVNNPHGAVTSLDDVLKEMHSEVSVEDREDIICLHFGLKHQYKSFAIAIASSKEATARDKLLTALRDKPFTLITDDEEWYLPNTRYLYWLSFISGLGGATLLVFAQNKFIKLFFLKLMSS